MTRQVYCVLGKPIAHSLSPALHNRLLNHHGVEAGYVAFETDDAAGAVRAVRTLGIAGASVTLPNKTAVLPALDEVTPEARDVGAVNTLLWRDGRLVGANTDVDGMRALLRGLGADLSGATVLLLGAGGAARVAARTLLEESPARIVVCARNPSRRQAFLDWLAPLAAGDSGRVELAGIEPGRSGPLAPGESCDLAVNATPVGMFPDAHAAWLDGEALGRVGAVLDLVYNPVPTRTVAEAQRRGIRARGGFEMFAVQASRQFEMWTGIAPDLEYVREALRGLLSGREA